MNDTTDNLLGEPLSQDPHLTTARITKLPKCSFCDREAGYDGKTAMGPWAYMCEGHFKAYGKGLGLGLGQKLILAND